MTGDRCATSVFPGKARDLFAAAENVFPVPFCGVRLHVLLKSREPWALAHGLPLPPSGWSAASAFKVSTNGPCAGWRAAGTLGVRWPRGCLAAGTAEVNPLSGDWSFEAVGRSASDTAHVSLTGQVCGWRRPLACECDVDFTRPAGALSVRVDPVRRECAFQCLQAVTSRLSLGAELAVPLKAFPPSLAVHPALMARYAGPTYLACGRVDLLAGRVKFAWYRHNNDRLQTAFTVEADRSWSSAVARMAFRRLAGQSAVHAAIGTDGVISSQVEKWLTGGVSVALSARVECKTGRSGVGAGLSFG